MANTCEIENMIKDEPSQDESSNTISNVSEESIKDQTRSNAESRVYRCKDCQLDFKHYAAYFIHIQREHFKDTDDETGVEEQSEDDKSQPERDFEDDLHFKSNDDFFEEKESKTKKTKSLSKKSVKKKEKPAKKAKEPKHETYTCELCGKILTRPGPFSRHFRNCFNKKHFAKTKKDARFRKKATVENDPSLSESQDDNGSKRQANWVRIFPTDDETVIPKNTRKVVAIPGIPDDCKKCGKHFEDDHVLCLHLRWDHFEKERGVDFKEVLQKERLENKLQASIRLKNYRKGQRVLTSKCDVCNRLFRNDQFLANHRKKYHNQETIINGKLIEAQTSRVYEMVICDQCGITIGKNELKHHVASIHHPENLCFPCDRCSKAYATQSRLFKHRRTSHPPSGFFNHTCTVCGRGFNCINSFRVHCRNHEGYRYQCSQCVRDFASSASHRVHVLRDHEKVKKYQCKYCGQRFWDSSNLSKHVKGKHADQVFHPQLFAENDRKYLEDDSSHRHWDSRGSRKQESSKLKTTVSRREVKTRKKSQDEISAASSFLESSSQCKGDYFHIQDEHHSSMTTIETVHDNYGVTYPQFEQNMSHGDRQHQSYHNLPQSFSCQVNSSHTLAYPDLQVFQEQNQMLNILHSSAKFLASAQLQGLNHRLSRQHQMQSGNCKLCGEISHDLRSHYMDSYKTKAQFVHNLLS